MDERELLKGRILPTIITDLQGTLLCKSNHKILRLFQLRKGFSFKYQITENSFESISRMADGEVAKAVLYIDAPYSVSVSKFGDCIILSIVSKMVYDLYDGVLTRQSSSDDFLLPKMFSPSCNLKYVCETVMEMLDGGEYSLRCMPMASLVGSYGEKQCFYELMSSIISLSLELSERRLVQVTGMAQEQCYRISTSVKLYKNTEDENYDIPAAVNAEVTVIEQLAKSNYWLFSAHITNRGIMELTLDMPVNTFLAANEVAERKETELVKIVENRINKLINR